MTALKKLLFTAAFCVLSGASAHAGIVSLDFDLTTLTAMPGETVTARGTLTNLSTTSVVDLNSCSVTLPGHFTTDSCAIFLSLTGAPISLGIGESATVDLFTFTPDAAISPIGLQPAGIFTVLGTPEINGYDPETQNILAEAPFQVTVAPEPSTFALFGLALPLALALRRRK